MTAEILALFTGSRLVFSDLYRLFQWGKSRDYTACYVREGCVVLHATC